MKVEQFKPVFQNVVITLVTAAEVSLFRDVCASYIDHADLDFDHPINKLLIELRELSK